jgi:3-carboxy-cis,cis-muconate cycloisomerase
MSDPIFGAMFSTPAVTAATADLAWLRAMLDVEAALAAAGAATGLVPRRAAEAIAACATVDRFDPASIGARAAGSATPVIALVSDLTALVPPEHARYVHLGATSQDVIDTAMCLVAARTLDDDLAAGAAAAADLAERYRCTPQLGRTLLQPAAPTTFGAVCAGWLVALEEAVDALLAVRRDRLAVQFGGAVGTLAALGGSGHAVAAALAAELGLALPTVPWHTSRGRIAELAAAIGLVTGALGRVGLDVTLLAQGEVGEVAEGSPGGSSAMPHKRNPSRSTLITACAHRVPGLVATVFAGQPQELQRAAGRWQAEWQVVTDLLRLLGAAAAHHRILVCELRVDPARMAANLATANLATADLATDVAAADVAGSRSDPGALDAAAAVVDLALAASSARDLGR